MLDSVSINLDLSLLNFGIKIIVASQTGLGGVTTLDTIGFVYFLQEYFLKSIWRCPFSDSHAPFRLSGGHPEHLVAKSEGLSTHLRPQTSGFASHTWRWGSSPLSASSPQHLDNDDTNLRGTVERNK